MLRAGPTQGWGPRGMSLVLAMSLVGGLVLLGTVATPAAAQAKHKTHGTLSFSGYTWRVKKSGGMKVGPGPNYFSKDNVWVDSLGRLHLAITKVGRHWKAGEVANTQSLGYGTYTWTLDSRVDNLDPNMVLGLFTYDWTSPQLNFREIDIEASRWSNPSDPTNAQFVVQPYATAGNLTRITQGSSVPATFSFHWTSTGLSFSTPGASPASWTYTGSDKPPAGGEVADMNLWLNDHAPMYGLGAEVVIRSFTFTPG